MIAMLKNLLHHGADELNLFKQRHWQNASIAKMVRLVRRMRFHLEADVQHFRDSLLEMMHLLHKVSEILRLLDLSGLEQRVIHGANQDEGLAPVYMRRVTDLLQTGATLLVFELLWEVKVLFVDSLHNVWLEYRFKDLKLA